ncbi:Vitamin B12 ABC transporter, permease protein [Escherichia coli]|nr:Vitamin B12 ABC transporter, permease protein [Escherichia coli]
MTWAIYFSTSVDLRQLMYWMMGGFGGVDWRQSWLMLALIPVLLWICCQSRPMKCYTWRDLGAATGLPLWFWANVLVAATGWMLASVWRWRVLSALLSGDPPYSPVVWFNRSSRITSGCALAGASALLLADIVARLALAAAELPIGVVTATLGAPVFIWLLLKAGR